MPTPQQRLAGILEVAISGQTIRWVGDLEYNLGAPLRTPMVGSSGVDGYKEEIQVPYIAGQIRNTPDLDAAALVNLRDATVVARLANGKGVAGRNGWFAGPGTMNTAESTIEVRFEFLSLEEFTT